MPTPVEQITKLGDQLLETVSSVQTPVVDTVAKVSERVEPSIPTLPTIPQADRVPTAEEIVKATFDFLERLLAQERAFVESLVAAAKPVADKVVSTEPAAPAKSTKGSKAA